MIKAGLDIGNSKISCVIADYKNTENINILSIASVPNNNIKNLQKNYILLSNEDNKLFYIPNINLGLYNGSELKLKYIEENTWLLNGKLIGNLKFDLNLINNNYELYIYISLINNNIIQ